MNLHYRILKLDETEFSFTVRYSTDLLSERELSIDPNEQSDTPARCRTDYNLTMWKPDMTEQELHLYILQSAPVDWLRLREELPNPTRMQAVAALVGRPFKRAVLANGRVDLTGLVPPPTGGAGGAS